MNNELLGIQEVRTPTTGRSAKPSDFEEEPDSISKAMEDQVRGGTAPSTADQGVKKKEANNAARVALAAARDTSGLATSINLRVAKRLGCRKALATSSAAHGGSSPRPTGDYMIQHSGIQLGPLGTYSSHTLRHGMFRYTGSRARAVSCPKPYRLEH